MVWMESERGAGWAFFIPYRCGELRVMREREREVSVMSEKSSELKRKLSRFV